MVKKLRPTITAHCLVRNEENYIHTVIESVLPYVDKMIIYDTGSTDRTGEIIQKILTTAEGKRKIHFEQKGEVNASGHTTLRNEMIKNTTTDWFFILDGDEVWPEEQIQFLVNKDIPAAELLQRNCIMVSYHLSVVDIYHYTESGHFSAPWGLHGHFTFRCFKKVDGIAWRGKYNSDVLEYSHGKQVVTQDNILFSTAYFWHLSKLPRSSGDKNVFSRLKPSKLKVFPPVVRKFLVKKYEGNLPVILERKYYEN